MWVSGTMRQPPLAAANSSTPRLSATVTATCATRRCLFTEPGPQPVQGAVRPDRGPNPRQTPAAQLARDKQACPKTVWQRVAGVVEKRRSVQKFPTRGGRADLGDLRSQQPLHDTADELCAVARDLRLSPDDILLGARANEAAIKVCRQARSVPGAALCYARHDCWR